MLDGFGLAPVCLELDLDSYDGPWTHVERFRGRTGWLVVAEARVVSAGPDWATTLVAASDDYGESVPAFMAPNLLACACSLPGPCESYPPDYLDDLLDEAADELKLRWLRDTNTALGKLADAAAERIATLEGSTKAHVDDLNHRVADLRRRQRMPGVPDAARGAFADVIVGFELEREAAIERLSRERAQARRAVEEEERALVARTRVHVAVEPLYHVSWSAKPRSCEEMYIVRDHMRGWTAFSPHASRRSHDESGQSIAAMLAQEGRRLPSMNGMQLPVTAAVQMPSSPVPAARVTAQAPVLTKGIEWSVQPCPVEATTSATLIAPPTRARSSVEDEGRSASVPVPVGAVRPPHGGKLRIERDALARQLADLEETGRRFLRGSPKFDRNCAMRAELTERIRLLDARLTEQSASVVVEPLTVESSMVAERAELEAELAQHKKRGAKPSDGMNPFRRFRDRRLYLLGRIAELNARIARLAARKEKA